MRDPLDFVVTQVNLLEGVRLPPVINQPQLVQVHHFSWELPESLTLQRKSASLLCSLQRWLQLLEDVRVRMIATHIFHTSVLEVTCVFHTLHNDYYFLICFCR